MITEKTAQRPVYSNNFHACISRRRLHKTRSLLEICQVGSQNHTLYSSETMALFCLLKVIGENGVTGQNERRLSYGLGVICFHKVGYLVVVKGIMDST